MLRTPSSTPRKAVSNIRSGAPGSAYALPPPISGTDTSDSGQQRGEGPAVRIRVGHSVPRDPRQTALELRPHSLGSSRTVMLSPRRRRTTLAMISRQSTDSRWRNSRPGTLYYPDGQNCTTQFFASYDHWERCLPAISRVAITQLRQVSVSPTTQRRPAPPRPGAHDEHDFATVPNPKRQCLQL